MKKEQRIQAWAVTSPTCPLYFLGEGAYLNPDPFAIFKEPEDVFRYFVHIEDARDAEARMTPVTIIIPRTAQSIPTAFSFRTCHHLIANAETVIVTLPASNT